jgi:hypothetical protein
MMICFLKLTRMKITLTQSFVVFGFKTFKQSMLYVLETLRFGFSFLSKSYFFKALALIFQKSRSTGCLLFSPCSASGVLVFPTSMGSSLKGELYGSPNCWIIEKLTSSRKVGAYIRCKRTI